MTTANKTNIIKRIDLNRPMYNSEMDSNLEELKKLIDDVQALEESNVAATKFSIGLGEVDNTSDLDKPISNATQAELDLKMNAEDALSKAGGIMTGALTLFAGSTAPNLEVSDKSGSIANTRFVHNAIGVGSLAFFPLSTPAPGYLPLNGQAVSRTTYAELFAYLGTTFGSGDGVSTFNLPDYRGMFPRFWDNGAGIDPGRTIGSVQGQSLQSHNHYLPTEAEGDGIKTWALKDSSSNTVWSKSLVDKNVSGIESATTFPNPLYLDGTAGGSIGTFGTETRPINITMLACIKY